MKIYLIPGLGYTHRIFEKLDLSNYNTTFINWIDPKPKETINQYALRIFKQFKNHKKEEKVILIGHSLGGIIAQEIASIKQIDKVILISSIKSRNELPFFFKLIKPLYLYKFFTKEISLKTVRFWGKNHGFETKEKQGLFKEMVCQQSNSYLQWALKSLSSWQTPKLPTSIIQIHGTDDKTFPIKHIKNPNFIIKKGSHIFVYNQADKVDEIIRQQL